MSSNLDHALKIFKLLIAKDLNNASLLFKGLSIIGLAPPALPALIDTARNALFPEEQKAPCKIEEMLSAIQRLKDEDPVLYEKIVESVTKKG